MIVYSSIDIDYIFVCTHNCLQPLKVEMKYGNVSADENTGMYFYIRLKFCATNT